MIPKWTKSDIASITVQFLLFDRFSNMCLANCLEPMRAANTLVGREFYRWRFLSLSGDTVASSSGLPILPHAELDPEKTCDYLFVVASYDFLKHDTADCRRRLRACSKSCKVMVGLDTGPWLMASAGLLAGRRATLHWETLDSFSERFLNIDTVRHRVVKDNNRITCAGAMSAFDLTRSMIEDHLGSAVALDVDAMLLRDDPLALQHRGKSKPSTSPVQRAIAAMQSNIEQPLSLNDLSKIAACPPKTLLRRFKVAFSATPIQVYRHIRLTNARQLVESTSLSMSEIALRSGYESAAALSRAFRLRFGVSPRELSKTYRSAR